MAAGRVGPWVGHGLNTAGVGHCITNTAHWWKLCHNLFPSQEYNHTQPSPVPELPASSTDTLLGALAQLPTGSVFPISLTRAAPPVGSILQPWRTYSSGEHLRIARRATWDQLCATTPFFSSLHRGNSITTQHLHNSSFFLKPHPPLVTCAGAGGRGRKRERKLFWEFLPHLCVGMTSLGLSTSASLSPGLPLTSFLRLWGCSHANLTIASTQWVWITLFFYLLSGNNFPICFSILPAAVFNSKL